MQKKSTSFGVSLVLELGWVSIVAPPVVQSSQAVMRLCKDADQNNSFSQKVLLGGVILIDPS